MKRFSRNRDESKDRIEAIHTESATRSNWEVQVESNGDFEAASSSIEFIDRIYPLKLV